LMPPLAFTQAKYAAAMFGMSVNEVPGWLVAMAPSAIGVPVAATPGLAPHDEELTAAGVEALEPLEALGGGAVLVLLELLELLLLLHPAAPVPTARAAAARTIIVRADGAIIPLLISPPQGSDFRCIN
jgi:hypothetical protein